KKNTQKQPCDFFNRMKVELIFQVNFLFGGFIGYECCCQHYNFSQKKRLGYKCRANDHCKKYKIDIPAYFKFFFYLSFIYNFLFFKIHTIQNIKESKQNHNG